MKLTKPQRVLLEEASTPDPKLSMTNTETGEIGARIYTAGRMTMARKLAEKGLVKLIHPLRFPYKGAVVSITEEGRKLLSALALEAAARAPRDRESEHYQREAFMQGVAEAEGVPFHGRDFEDD